MEFFSLLFISVPVFYVTGLVVFIRWIAGISSKNKIGRRKFLEAAINELSGTITKSPKKTLVILLQDYKAELQKLNQTDTVKLPSATEAEQTKTSEPTTSEAAAPQIVKDELVSKKSTTSLTRDWENFFSNWYSDNSINLLLYLGAFLIVASASIFVGFQWETIGGAVKASLLSALIVAFFGSGALFYNISKIKQAGATFIAIAALLIPFGGLAWHNFVLGPAGYSIGSVWFATSIIAVVSYASLAYFIRHPFYTYIAGFGGLSMILSIVNTSQLNREFYVLGGIFSAFILLLSTRLFNQKNEDELNNYVTPLSLSANIIMPIALVFGMLLAANGGKLFTLEVVISAFLATLYYILAYTFDREIGYLYVSLLLLPVSTLLFGKWLDISLLQILIPIQIIPFIYLSISSYLKQKYPKEYEATSMSAHILLPFALFLSFITSITLGGIFQGEIVVSSLLATAFYALAYYFSKESSFILLSQLLLPISVFLTGKWLDIDNIVIIVILQIIASIYLGVSYLINKSLKVSEAFTISANTIVPISLFWLFTEAAMTDSFYSGGVALAALLGSFFYLAAYGTKRSVLYLVAWSIILPLAIFIFSRWSGLSELHSYYLMEILFVIYLAISFPLRKFGNKEDSESLTVVALGYGAGMFFWVFGKDFGAFQDTLFAVMPAVFGLAAVYLQKSTKYLYYNIIFLVIAVYLYFSSLLGFEDRPEFVGSAYLALTIIFYLLAITTSKYKGTFTAFAFGAVLTASLGHLLTLGQPAYFFIGNIIVAAIFADYGIRFGMHQYIYISNLFIFIALWSLLRRFDTQIALYPFFFSGLSFAFYAVAQGVTENLKHFYRLSALVGTGVTTVVFGLIGQSEGQSYYSTSEGRFVLDNSYDGLGRNALISSYATTFLYALDAAITKVGSLGYFASAVGMFTYLWQIKFLGFSEIQAYTLPLGVYFLVLSYFQRLSGNIANRDLLNYVGLFFLFIPTFFQSFGTEGAKYALLMGVEGLVIFGLGTSLRYKIYTYAGLAAIVVAIVSQTYEFVFSLPRWMITAAAGILLLSTAIFLLLRRKEEPGK
ncbi:MAG: hypothetical protein A2Z11_04665 [Candidatus Woykebacteria bacterium RBG_16_43_9]|uniref:Uncharacterized protein n=1 Tax=Candidatus Woykebacteria bacterium RBG_16_43_9 TaxID=1802596 RepID=A0A1G1WD89_9BACT|nr:MAG: hypothetical protein A2Z11_04665 [Candidatus Woykebacteria bacterium RBG_16_43_9]